MIGLCPSGDREISSARITGNASNCGWPTEKLKAKGNDDEIFDHSRHGIFFSERFAQAAPKVGNKPLAQVKPKEPMGCKLVGTVKGTKLWAGDCVGSELKGAAPAAETKPPSGQDSKPFHPVKNSRAGAEGAGEIVVPWLNAAANDGRHKRMTSFEEWRKRTPAPK
jgi:hypothetical protein